MSVGKYVICTHNKGTLKEHLKVGEIYEVEQYCNNDLYLKIFPCHHIHKGILSDTKVEPDLSKYSGFEFCTERKIGDRINKDDVFMDTNDGKTVKIIDAPGKGKRIQILNGPELGSQLSDVAFGIQVHYKIVYSDEILLLL